MKLLIKKMLKSNRGESLVESLVSVVVLAIFIMAITSMIAVSTRITARSFINADDRQENLLNPLMRGEFDAVSGNFNDGDIDYVDEDAIIILTIRHDIGGIPQAPFDVTENIDFYHGNGLWAFSPP